MNFANGQADGSNPFGTPSPNAHPSSIHTSPQQAPPLSYDSSPKVVIDNTIPMFSQAPPQQFPSIPLTFSELPQWNAPFSMPQQESYGMSTLPQNASYFDDTYSQQQTNQMADFLNPSWSQDNRGTGLNHEQQSRLMQDFEMNEAKTIEQMIQQSHQLFRPPQVQTYCG